jgi:hypothetical protein
MPIYTFWFKKQINCDSLDKAIKKANKIKPVFDSIKQHDEPTVEERASLIGFNYYPSEDEDDDE